MAGEALAGGEGRRHALIPPIPELHPRNCPPLLIHWCCLRPPSLSLLPVPLHLCPKAVSAQSSLAWQV